MSYLTLADLGAYSDYAWFVNECNNAKSMAAKTGNVDGAKKLVDDALRMWQNGPFNLGNDPSYDPSYQTPADFATNAKNYIETFRPAQQQLQTASASATGGQQAYYASPEQQKLANEQIAAEKQSIQVAKAPWPFSLMYEAAPAIANPTGFAAGPAPVEAATGAPAGTKLEAATIKVENAISPCLKNPMDASCWPARTAAGALGGGAIGGILGLVTAKSSVGALIGFFSGATLGAGAGYLSASLGSSSTPAAAPPTT